MVAEGAMSFIHPQDGNPRRFPAICALCLMALVVGSCMPRQAVIGTGEKASAVGGTISGTVREAVSNTAVSGRLVTATEVTTGAEYKASTNVSGGYTMKVPIGRYRLSVELRDGETVKGPAELTLNVSDLDAARDFVITVKSPGGR
jgi:uncharacterized protein YcfJ